MKNGTHLPDELRLEVPEMDREHDVLFRLIRELQTALARSDRELAVECLERVHDFASAHFISEDLLMRLHAYPDYGAHRDEHDSLLAQLSLVKALVASGDDTGRIEKAAILEAWLRRHMGGPDRALAEWLAGAGRTGSPPEARPQAEPARRAE